MRINFVQTDIEHNENRIAVLTVKINSLENTIKKIKKVLKELYIKKAKNDA